MKHRKGHQGRALRKRYGHARLHGDMPKRIRAAWGRGHKGTCEIGRYTDGTWFCVSRKSAWPFQIVENALGVRGAIGFKIGHKAGAEIAEREGR
jgi:hypothetical protein